MNELLEWLKVLGPIVFSWPTVGLLAIWLFREPIMTIPQHLDLSKVTKAKIGGIIEFERELKQLSKEVTVQQEVQAKLSNEIRILRFLLNNFVSVAELKHLKKLSGAMPFPYRNADYFVQELRRLRSFGLIENLPNKSIRDLPATGELTEFFKITERGVEYLRLLDSLNTTPDQGMVTTG